MQQEELLITGCIFLICAGPPRPGRSDLARFARLAEVGEAAGRQLVSPADLSTIVS